MPVLYHEVGDGLSLLCLMNESFYPIIDQPRLLMNDPMTGIRHHHLRAMGDPFLKPVEATGAGSAGLQFLEK
jgi:hypothetical protein